MEWPIRLKVLRKKAMLKLILGSGVNRIILECVCTFIVLMSLLAYVLDSICEELNKNKSRDYKTNHAQHS